jgi:hypothetical protein
MEALEDTWENLQKIIEVYNHNDVKKIFFAMQGCIDCLVVVIGT